MTSIMDPNWGVFANRPPSPFGGPLTDTGFFTGNPDMAADYSGTPQDFWFEVPAGFNFDLHAVYARMCMGDKPLIDDYGDIEDGLENGILFSARRSGVTTALGPPIKTNKGWAFAATGQDNAGFKGSGQRQDVWTWSTDIQKVFGTHDRFYGAQGDRYTCTVSDDLTDLDCHRVYIFGTVTKIVL